MDSDKQLIVDSYKDGMSLYALQKKFKRGCKYIVNVLDECGIKRRTLKEINSRKIRHVLLTSDIVEVLCGEILGDAHIAPGVNQSLFEFCSAKEDYMIFLRSLLSQSEIPVSNLRKVTTYDKRTNKTYVQFRFRTKSCIEFLNMRNEWYKNGVKIVPKGLNLTKMMLLHWWMGDGFINKRSRQAYICTDSFQSKEVLYLVGKINELVGTNSKLKYRKNPGGAVIPRIYFSKTDIKLFLNFIGESPVKSLEYRWRI